MRRVFLYFDQCNNHKKEQILLLPKIMFSSDTREIVSLANAGNAPSSMLGSSAFGKAALFAERNCLVPPGGAGSNLSISN